MTLAANDPVPNSKSDTFPKTTQARDRRLENGDELDREGALSRKQLLIA